MRVCVLVASYEESTSRFKDLGDYEMTPAHFFPPSPGAPACDWNDEYEYVFDQIALIKNDVYDHVQRLVRSGKYDVFFNLCDGCMDEDIAGVEVVKALEEFRVPFTGANSRYYEISKPDQKMRVRNLGISTPKFALVDDPARIPEKCRHLTFPVIVKHYQGYASIGMTKDSKCENMEALVARATHVLPLYRCALIEEFIPGDEVTVLACADPSEADGVRVYPPVITIFPEGEEFKHFDLKWTNWEGASWQRFTDTHDGYQAVVDVGRRAFKHLMGGVGYGCMDLRIDGRTGDVHFLEINTNCGIMYPPGEESMADLSLHWASAHQPFIKLQIQTAIEACERSGPVA